MPNWWPFGGDAPSNPGDVTDVLATALQRLASAHVPDADPSVSGAVAIASSLYSAAFSSVEVVSDTAPQWVVDALTPRVLAHFGREYPRRGDAAALIETNSREASPPRLIPCYVKEVREDGMIETQRTVGTDTVDRVVQPGALAWIRYEDRPPWQKAAHAAQALANLERSTSLEGKSPVGMLLSTASDVSGEVGELQDDTLIQQLNAAKGELVRLPAQSDRGILASPDVATPPPAREGQLTRLGPEYREHYDRLHQEYTATVLLALGVPSQFAASGTNGASLREAHRWFVANAVKPLLRILAFDLGSALDAPDLQLAIPEIERFDVVAKARAYGSLVGGGMDEAEAARLVGLRE